MPLLQFKKQSPVIVPLTLGPVQSFQLQELSSQSQPQPSCSTTTTLSPNDIESPHSISSCSSSSEDDVQYNRKSNKFKSVKPKSPLNNNQVPDLLIPLPHFEITLPDVLFSWTVLLFVVLEFTLDVALIIWHANSEHMWASGLTGLFFVSGGVALLSQFWGINRDQLKRIYDHPTCVRTGVNSLPWLFTLITSYHSATTSYLSYSAPSTILHKHVKLQELTRSLLKIQTLAQAAPLSVTQLVVLLEDLDQLWSLSIPQMYLAATTTASIVVNLTLMMVANLPLKSDTVLECVPRAAYSPYSRLFVGLRMICNFASRTMSLSLYISSFRCSVFRLISSSPSPVLPHLIPVSVLLVPRLLFAVVHYLKLLLQRRNANASSSPPPPVSFADIALMYVASVFFPFGDVLWLYVYVTLETIVFIVFGFVFGEIVGGEGCIGMGIEGLVYFIVFLVFFGVVPCVVPWVSGKVSYSRARRARYRSSAATVTT